MIYLSSGMEKSGSTYTYFLAANLLEAAGYPPVHLDSETRNDRHHHDFRVNSVRLQEDLVVENIRRHNPEDNILLLRSHGGPTPVFLELLQSTGGKVHTTIRDPRDVALSMMDVHRKQLAHGRPNKQKLVLDDPTSAFRPLRMSTRRALDWLGRADSLILYYEQTCFDPTVSLDAICRQLGLDLVSHYDGVVARASANPSGKRNVARPNRHRRGMSAELQEKFLVEFRDFYDRLFPQADIVVEDAES